MSPDPAAPGDPAYDVCIVGAGPVGIAVALACAERGKRVLLVESGQDKETEGAASLSEADITDARGHAPMSIAVRRAMGGTSAWWGGRCVPFDPIDFASRPWIPDSRWPLGHAEIQPWLEAATTFFGCGPARFQAPDAPWLMEDAEFRDLERWAPIPDMARVHSGRLGDLGVTVMTSTTVTDIVPSKDRAHIESLTAKQTGRSVSLQASHYVLACGGLETTRLLLAAQRTRPALFGGPEGPLGQFYAGHMSGKLADIVFNRPQDARHADYFLDGNAFARRRFTLKAGTQTRDRLPNIAFWTDNPPFHDPAHRSGALSAVWMALAVPFIGRRLVSEGVRVSHVGPRPHRTGAHLLNVARRPDRLVRDIFGILRKRLFGRPRQPGFLLHSHAGRYALHYHAEQSPDPLSRVRLTDAVDAVDMPRLKIEMRFRVEDAAGIVRAHEVLDRALRSAGVGHLEFRTGPEGRVAAVMAQAADGFHQTGTTRMSAAPEDGVVDADSRVHGFDNLHIASSSVFPSAGQANPTLLAVALGLRLAARLAQPSSGG